MEHWKLKYSIGLEGCRLNPDCLLQITITFLSQLANDQVFVFIFLISNTKFYIKGCLIIILFINKSNFY